MCCDTALARPMALQDSEESFFFPLSSFCQNRTNSGYDLELIADVKSAVRIPVIASSGAGCPQHFVDAFQKSNADAALAAGIFHRQEVPISVVKDHLDACGVTVRGSAESVTS